MICRTIIKGEQVDIRSENWLTILPLSYSIHFFANLFWLESVFLFDMWHTQEHNNVFIQIGFFLLNAHSIFYVLFSKYIYTYTTCNKLKKSVTIRHWWMWNTINNCATLSSDTEYCGSVWLFCLSDIQHHRTIRSLYIYPKLLW